MAVCIIISAIIALLNIFTFLGDALDTSKYHNNDPSVFDLIKLFDYPTILFVLQICIMIVAVIVIIYCLANYDYVSEERSGIIISILMIVLSFVASILSLLTGVVIGTSYFGVVLRLGLGSILYSVFNGLIILLLLAAIIIRFVIEKMIIRRVIKKTRRNNVLSYGAKLATRHGYNQTPKTQVQSTLSETEKAELIIKYKKMFDDDIITKEEFEKKKKDLI